MAQDWSEWFTARIGCFTGGDRLLCTHCTAQWMGVRFAVGALKRKISVPAGFWTFIAYYMNIHRHATRNMHHHVVWISVWCVVMFWRADAKLIMLHCVGPFVAEVSGDWVSPHLRYNVQYVGTLQLWFCNFCRISLVLVCWTAYGALYGVNHWWASTKDCGQASWKLPLQLHYTSVYTNRLVRL